MTFWCRMVHFVPWFFFEMFNIFNSEMKYKMRFHCTLANTAKVDRF